MSSLQRRSGPGPAGRLYIWSSRPCRLIYKALYLWLIVYSIVIYSVRPSGSHSKNPTWILLPYDWARQWWSPSHLTIVLRRYICELGKYWYPRLIRDERYNEYFRGLIFFSDLEHMFQASYLISAAGIDNSMTYLLPREVIAAAPLINIFSEADVPDFLYWVWQIDSSSQTARCAVNWSIYILNKY